MANWLTSGAKKIVDKAAAFKELLTTRAVGDYRPGVVTSVASLSRPLPPFSLYWIERMLLDPNVGLALNAIKGPIMGAKWQVKAKDPQVAALVDATLKRFWKNGLSKVLQAIEYGAMGAEIVYHEVDGLIHYDYIVDFYVGDVTPLVDTEKKFAGIRVNGGDRSEARDILGMKAFWYAHKAKHGLYYGQTRLRRAFEPWYEKVSEGGAVDIRRMWFHKNAYWGGIMRHPDGTTRINGVEIQNRDIARQIMELWKTGGVIALPSTKVPGAVGGGGEYAWGVEPPTINGSAQEIREYPKDLDVDIIKGCDVPPEVLQASGETGSGYAGRSVPQQGFYAGLEEELSDVLSSIKEHLIDPLIQLRFGQEQHYEIETTPLLPPDQQQQGQPGAPGQPQQNPLAALMQQRPQPGQPPQKMSLDNTEADEPEYEDVQDILDALEDGDLDIDEAVEAFKALFERAQAMAIGQRMAFSFIGPRSGRQRIVSSLSSVPKSVKTSGAYTEIDRRRLTREAFRHTGSRTKEGLKVTSGAHDLYQQALHGHITVDEAVAQFKAMAEKFAGDVKKREDEKAALKEKAKANPRVKSVPIEEEAEPTWKTGTLAEALKKWSGDADPSGLSPAKVKIGLESIAKEPGDYGISGQEAFTLNAALQGITHKLETGRVDGRTEQRWTALSPMDQLDVIDRIASKVGLGESVDAYGKAWKEEMETPAPDAAEKPAAEDDLVTIHDGVLGFNGQPGAEKIPQEPAAEDVDARIKEAKEKEAATPHASKMVAPPKETVDQLRGELRDIVPGIRVVQASTKQKPVNIYPPSTTPFTVEQNNAIRSALRKYGFVDLIDGMHMAPVNNPSGLIGNLVIDADGPHQSFAESSEEKKKLDWQKTFSEFAQSHPDAESIEKASRSSGTGQLKGIEKTGNISREHRQMVEAALAAGKPVPADVLKDYPDLQAKGDDEPPAVRESFTEAIESARKTDEKFKGDGRYESDVWIKLHSKNPGEPLPTLSKAAAEYVRDEFESEGKPIPPQVFRDHPDLAPKAKDEPPAAAKAEDAAAPIEEPPKKKERPRDLRDDQISDREARRNFAEVMAMDNPEDASTKDLIVANGLLQAYIRHEHRRYNRGETTAEQRQSLVDGYTHESEILDRIIKDRVNGRSFGPESQTRAEKIAEKAVLENKNALRVATDMGLTTQEYRDIRDEVAQHIEEHRKIIAEGDAIDNKPSPARQRAMDKQKALQEKTAPEQAADAAAEKKAAPKAKPPKIDYANAITIAADDISKLRKGDVYRVMDSMRNAGAVNGMAEYIAKHRPELADEIAEASSDIAEERKLPRAPKGGAVSEVDGEFYEGGWIMPVHGLSKKTPKGDGAGAPSEPAKANENAKERSRAEPRKMTPEDIEAERQRREDARKWNEMNAGPLGKIKWLGENVNHKAMTDSRTTLDHWKEYADEIGPEGVKRLVAELEPKVFGQIRESIAEDAKKHESVHDFVSGGAFGKYSPDEHFEYETGQIRKNAEDDAVYLRGGTKGHLKSNPESYYARHLVQKALEYAKGVDGMHEVNEALAKAKTPAEAKPVNETGNQASAESAIESHLKTVGATDSQIAEFKASLADKDGVVAVGPKGARFVDAFNILTGGRDPHKLAEEIKKKRGETLYVVENAAARKAADEKKYTDRFLSGETWDSGNLSIQQQAILRRLVEEGKLTKRKGRPDESTADGVPDIYEPVKAKPSNVTTPPVKRSFASVKQAAKELDAIRNDMASVSPDDNLKERADAVGAWLAENAKQSGMGAKLLSEVSSIADRLEGGSGKRGVRIQMEEPKPADVKPETNDDDPYGLKKLLGDKYVSDAPQSADEKNLAKLEQQRADLNKQGANSRSSIVSKQRKRADLDERIQRLREKINPKAMSLSAARLLSHVAAGRLDLDLAAVRFAALLETPSD